MQETLNLILNKLESLSERTANLEQGQKELQETLTRIETKQTLIYDQVGNLSESKTKVINELNDIKGNTKHHSEHYFHVENESSFL